MRESEYKRDILERLIEFFPEKELLNYTDICNYLGCAQPHASKLCKGYYLKRTGIHISIFASLLAKSRDL